MEAKQNAKAKIKKTEGEVLLGPDGNFSGKLAFYGIIEG
jgi:hypothetical protein